MINMLISRLSFRFSIEGLKILTNKNSRVGRHMSHSRCCAARLRLLLYAQREFKGPRARRRNRPLAHYVPHIPFSLLPFIGFYCLFLLSLPSERGVPPSSLFIAHFPSLGDRRSCLWGENRFRHTARARTRVVLVNGPRKVDSIRSDFFTEQYRGELVPSELFRAAFPLATEMQKRDENRALRKRVAQWGNRSL